MIFIDSDPHGKILMLGSPPKQLLPNLAGSCGTSSTDFFPRGRRSLQVVKRGAWSEIPTLLRGAICMCIYVYIHLYKTHIDILYTLYIYSYTYMYI